MGSIDKYVLRTVLASFALILVSLTGVIWITQALRSIDLMTSQGQTILTFLGFTSLVIPALALVIAPLALVLAAVHALNKFAADSEIIVLNAAGLPPWRQFRPYLYATVIVALIVAFIATFLAPEGLRRLKSWDTEITADILTNVLQPGRFAKLEEGLTIRIGERQPGGLLGSIFFDDRRNPQERNSIVARRGSLLKNERGTFLVLEDGVLQRFESGKRDPTLVAFSRYAFDMSKFASRVGNVVYGVRERYLWELFTVSKMDPAVRTTPGKLRAELHDRLLAPLYPFAFVALAFALLGAPRTTRQSRNFSVANALLAVLGLRIAGFALSVLTARSGYAALAQYLLVFGTFTVSLWIILRGVVFEPPAWLTGLFDAVAARFLRRAVS